MIGILGEGQYNEWDEYVQNHRFGLIYHTSYWLKILRITYGFLPIIIADYRGGVCFGTPYMLHHSYLGGNRLFGITSAHSCNPLVNSSSELSELMLYSNILMKKHKIKALELRTSDDFCFSSPELINPSSSHSTHLLSLAQPYDRIRSNYHKSCIQRPLIKATNSNLKIVKGNSVQDIRIFYTLYESMRKKNGLLPQPLSFFFNLWNTLGNNDLCDVFHVGYRGIIISSQINLKFNKRYIYEYGATDQYYSRLHPSHLLIDHSIRTAISEGYKVFDFGRTEAANKGLTDFKRRWGGKEIILHYYSLPPNSNGPIAKKKYLNSLLNAFVAHSPKMIYHHFGQFLYKIAL